MRRFQNGNRKEANDKCTCQADKGMQDKFVSGAALCHGSPNAISRSSSQESMGSSSESICGKYQSQRKETGALLRLLFWTHGSFAVCQPSHGGKAPFTVQLWVRLATEGA